MSSGSFAEYLSALDEPSLIALLEARPDVLIEPVPYDFVQLAQRLDSTNSLVAAMRTLNGDAECIGETLAVLGGSSTVPDLAAWLDAPEAVVREAAAGLCTCGLAWSDSSGVLRLSQRLAADWSADIRAARPVEKIARTALVEDLRTAVAALGAATDGLRKPELIARLAELMADSRSLATRISRLPEPARIRLSVFQDDPTGYVPEFGVYGSSRKSAETTTLIRAGLVLPAGGEPEMPREVAVAAWRESWNGGLTGQPEIPRPDIDREMVHAAARAAAQQAVGKVTTLLDEARATPIAALKKGGVGSRERSRLARSLSIPEEDLPLWIDLAHAAGLLGATGKGYAPTAEYDEWRDAEPGRRWAVLASAWFSLEHAPSIRVLEGEKEIPPPLPLGSLAGRLRMALMTAAGPGGSVRATGDKIDWFFPRHGYDDVRRAERVAAAIREAELLGVISVDVLSDLGEHLVDVTGAIGTPPGETVDELAGRCDKLIPEATFSVVFQSDLTAVVAGQPTAAVFCLLRDAAVAESRGAAGTWRFTASSIRSALDAGWTASDLLDELRAVSAHELPQPLEYLVTDVARRHGHVRVRDVRSCIVCDEATTKEILHTRSLAKLQLSQVAPTVLASPLEPDPVLARLREAGFYPIAEDATGTMILQSRQAHEAPARQRAIAGHRPRRLAPADLARRLTSPPGNHPAPVSDALAALAGMNSRLNDAELELLADAVDHHRDIVITYRDKNGTRTVRQIRPQQLFGRWLDSWCHLRNDQRDFSVANIESVSPAGR